MPIVRKPLRVADDWILLGEEAGLLWAITILRYNFTILKRVEDRQEICYLRGLSLLFCRSNVASNGYRCLSTICGQVGGYKQTIFFFFFLKALTHPTNN